MSVFKAKNQLKTNWLERVIKRYQESPLLSDDLIKSIFDNVRNTSLSLLPLVAAKVYKDNKYHELEGWVNFAVIFFVILSILLLALNLWHGVKKITYLNVHPYILFFGTFIYVTASALLFRLLLETKIV